MAKKKSVPEKQDETFDSLLKEFNDLWLDQKSSKDLTKFAMLKRKAKDAPFLNYRQRAAITDRCDNVINGTYGKTKEGIQFYPSENGKQEK